MRFTVLMLALAGVVTFAADNAAVTPRTAANQQSAISNLKSVDAVSIPQMLSYQGKLTDTLGVPVADTTYSVEFGLYTVPSGGSPFWSETQSVRTEVGLFSVVLGSVTSIGSVPDGGELYLGMAVGGGSELAPRLRIGSAAYAYLSERAANSDLLQGRDTTTFSRSTHNHDATYVNEGQANAVTGAMLVNGTIAAADLGQMGAGSGQVMKWTGSAWQPRNDSIGGGGGGGTVTSVAQDTGIVCSPNPITTTGSVKLNLAYSDGRYVNVTGDSMTGALAVQSDLRVYGKGRIGLGNSNAGAGAFVAGEGNSASANYASVSGGADNTASGTYSHISGGGENQAGGGYSVVGGGQANSSSGVRSVVGGGVDNEAVGIYSMVGGGNANSAGDAASDTAVTVCGGLDNTATSECAFVGGGRSCLASGDCATVGGGKADTASGNYSTVAGGQTNAAVGSSSAIGGGSDNRATGGASAIAGGSDNEATASYAAIGGGNENYACSSYACIGGGIRDTASGAYSVIAGGYLNKTLGSGSAIGGGFGNVAETSFATVAGGFENTASGAYATVGGGYNNAAETTYSTVGGGSNNTASGKGAAVVGGEYNLAGGKNCFIAGGQMDTVTGQNAFAANYMSYTSYSNSAAFNGTVATASNQTRVAVLSKGSGTFTIDHPLDPYGKILNHYFIEGPEMRNIYDGEAVLDASGRAVVALPDYFDALNRGPRVQLTGVGTREVVYVAEDVSGNRFTIGGPAGAKVYWQVTGERKDVSAAATRRMMPVEQPKSGPLAGRMLDDDFLAGCMDQLVREGKAQGIDFRTASGRAKYEKMKQHLREAGEK